MVIETPAIKKEKRKNQVGGSPAVPRGVIERPIDDEPVPGSLTRIIPAMVAPRKISSETKRAGLTGDVAAAVVAADGGGASIVLVAMLAPQFWRHYSQKLQKARPRKRPSRE